MGQYWKLVDIDRREDLAQISNHKFPPYLRRPDLIELLRRPEWHAVTFDSSAIAASKRSSVEASLLGLPQEILDEIVESICLDAVTDDVNVMDANPGRSFTLQDMLYPPMEFDPEKEQQLDVICLAMTCSYFFRLLVPKIHEIMVRTAAPWSGHRLIMIGDYADDLPLEVEQNATADELSRWKRREDERYHNPLYQWARKPQNINLLGNEDRWMNIWTQRIIQENENQENEDLKLAKRLLKLPMAEVPASFPPESTPLVLRNLTTKEYVLEEGLSSHSFNLGHAIVVQAQFTEDPSGLTGIAEHGIWAGHRFDVATLEDVDTNEWVDVTDVAIELISMEYDGEEL